MIGKQPFDPKEIAPRPRRQAAAGAGAGSSGPGEAALESIIVQFTQDLSFRHAAVSEFQNAIAIAAMRDVLVAGAYSESGRAHVDQESRNQLLLPARGIE